MSLSENKYLRLLTLCMLYVAQGIPFGFVTITLAAYLAGQGVGAKEIGTVIAMTSLPWSFKFLWGPIIDRFGYPAMGRRRPWILVAQTLMALTVGAMILIPNLSTQTGLLAALVCLHNIFASLQDVSVDALAVDLLTEDERGKANGLMYGSSYLGTFLGSSVAGIIAFKVSLEAALLFQVLAIFIIMLHPLLLRERPGEKLLPWTAGKASQQGAAAQTPSSSWKLFHTLGLAFRLRSAYLSAGLALVVKIGIGVSAVMIVDIAIHQLGWKEVDYSRISGYAVWMGLAGSFAGGFLADFIGARRLAMMMTVLQGLLWVVFALAGSLWGNPKVIAMMLFAEHLVFSMLSVSLFALFMGISSPAVAASQFTAFMALMNLSNTFGAKWAGSLNEWLGGSGVYFAMGVFQCATVILLFLIDPTEVRRKVHLQVLPVEE